MMKLNPEESELVGNWIFDNKKIRRDEICERIEWLIKNELQYVAATSGGWEKLYFDPVCGRYWELTHPNGEMQGGGPPILKVISKEVAKRKYIL